MASWVSRWNCSYSAFFANSSYRFIERTQLNPYYSVWNNNKTLNIRYDIAINPPYASLRGSRPESSAAGLQSPVVCLPSAVLACPRLALPTEQGVIVVVGDGSEAC